MSFDVRDLYNCSEPSAKRQRTDDVQSMSTANADPKDILTALENDESLVDDVQEVDEDAIKRLCLQLDKKWKKNQEMRVKHSNEPERFMQSEIELNNAIQEMHAIATQPSMYGKLVDLNVVQTLIQLLAHENTDIVGAVCYLLQELCDFEILQENDEDAAALIDDLLKNNIIEHYVTQPLARLRADDKDESEAIYQVFSTIENILEFRSEAADLCVEQGLFVELMNRATLKSTYDANKLYASQLLSVVLQTSEAAKAKLVERKDGIDFILRALAYYKKHDPETTDEVEHMENLFNALCAALLRIENREVFLKDEGNELMIIMLKEKKASREGALRVLSYVTAVPHGTDNCNHIVEIRGLSLLFPLFMRTPSNKNKKDKSAADHEENICSIIEALLFSCSDENRQRVLRKFSENDCEKVDRLVELFLSHSDKLRRYIARYRRQHPDADDEELEMERLNNGFYIVGKIALILADVCLYGPDQCSTQASNLFRMKTKNASIFEHLSPILEELLLNLGGDAESQRNKLSSMLGQLRERQDGPQSNGDTTATPNES